MKKYLLIIFTLFLLNMQAFAQENSTIDDKKNDSSLKEKLKTIEKTSIITYDFNPVKNKKGVATLIEFNDLSCKECLRKSKEFYASLDKEDLKYVTTYYKHANVNSLKLLNQITATALIADRLGVFWEFKDAVALKDYSKEEDQIYLLLGLGVDKDKLQVELSKSPDELYKLIDADANYAETLKGKTVPMFYIDGYKIGEDISREELKTYIKEKVDNYKKAIYDEENKYKMGKF